MARLKQQPGKDLTVLGSGELVQSLMRRNPRNIVPALLLLVVLLTLVELILA